MNEPELEQRQELINKDTAQEANKTKKIVITLALIGYLLSILLAVALYVVSNNLTSEMAAVKQKAEENRKATQSELDRLTSDVFNVKKDRLVNFLAHLSHVIEYGVITEELIVDKIIFNPEDPESLFVVIGVETQPKISMKYDGDGKFKMSDREVKGMVGDILKNTRESYDEAGKKYEGLAWPDWDKGEIVVTIDNYEIGRSTNGVFKLKGEK